MRRLRRLPREEEGRSDSRGTRGVELMEDKRAERDVEGGTVAAVVVTVSAHSGCEAVNAVSSYLGRPLEQCAWLVLRQRWRQDEQQAVTSHCQ